MGSEEVDEEGAGMIGTGLQGGQMVEINFADRHPIIGTLSYSITRDTNNIMIAWSERIDSGFLQHSTVIPRMLIAKITVLG